MSVDDPMLPHDRRAEMVVLCGMIREIEIIYPYLYCAGLSASDFYF